MDYGFGLLNSLAKPAPDSLAGGDVQDTAAPKLLVELEPASRVFFRNLADILLLRRPPEVELRSPPGAFWPDVFVPTQTPWLGFVESILWHGLLMAAGWSLSQAWALRQETMPRLTFHKSDVIYYTPAEYLPPLNTGSAPAREARRGEPEHARQPIISVPPEADNRTQTIVTPPSIKLEHEVPVPNIVAWNSVNPAVPLAATERTRLTAPALEPSIVAPPPVVEQAHLRSMDPGRGQVVAPAPDVTGLSSQRDRNTTAAGAVIEPPPTVQGASRRVGDLNIGQSEIVAPAPRLPLAEQRSTFMLGQATNGADSGQVVPPPPSVQVADNHAGRSFGAAGNGSGQQVVPPPPASAGAGSSANGRIIALGIHPVTGPPPADLAGNRRGTFAATPEGKAGAAGTPDISADVGGNGAGGRGKGRDGGAGSGTAATGLPPGLMVGAGPKAGSAVASGPAGSGPGAAGDPSAGNSNGSLVADNRPMRVTVNPEKTLPNDPSAAIAREVFGNRRSYPMIENMPNLNSRGGTWIIRFAEAKPIEDGHFTAPSSIRKVDPGYPQELIRQNVNGTLTLYAVVRSDGTVGNVRVINSPDERLDRYACAAFERWQFRPATMNGKPIDVEAVVIIPFRTGRGF